MAKTNELKTWDRLVAGAYLHRKAGGRKPHPHFAARIARRYGENLTRAYAWARADAAEQSRRDFWEWLQKARKDGRGQDA